MWRKPVEDLERRVDQREDSSIARGRGKPRKNIGETIKRDLNVNGLNINMIYDRTLWSRPNHVVDPPIRTKFSCCCCLVPCGHLCK